MNLEEFAARGLKAQAAVDEITEKFIAQSTDTAWLSSVMNNADLTISIRTAAQKRLRELKRKKDRI